jgi:hypothetical protein
VSEPLSPSPGWYPDPEGGSHLRWWGGSAWTDFVAELPAAAVSAAPEPEPEPEPEPAPVVALPTREPVPEPEEEPLPPAAAVPVVDPAPEPEPEPEPLPPAAAVPIVEPEPEPEPLPAPATAAAVAAREPELATEPPPAPQPELEWEPLPWAAGPGSPVEAPAPAASVAAVPAAPARRGPRPLVLGLAALVVAGAAVAGTLALTGSDDSGSASLSQAPSADRECLQVWNGTQTPQAADLRAAVASFEPTHARVARVEPLPGTLMQPGSCALTLYQADTGEHMTLIAGVKDQIGYIDATTYPRAAQLGWPQSKGQANVRVTRQGTIRALPR